MNIFADFKDNYGSFLFYENDKRTLFLPYVYIIYLLQGETAITCDGITETMNPGDFILVKEPSKVLLSPSKRSLFLVEYFDYILFKEQFGIDFQELRCDSMGNASLNTSSIRSAILKLALSDTNDAVANRFLQNHNMYQLFHLILKEHYEGFTPSEDAKASTKQEEKTTLFKSYMNLHYKEAVSLQKTAEIIGYTPQYLSNFLKKQLGTTFNSYLNTLRVLAASDYLKYREYSIDKISSICGFSQTAAFRKSFEKEINLTPEDYRQLFIEGLKPYSEIPEVVSDRSFIIDVLSDASPAQASVKPKVIRQAEQHNVVCNTNEYTIAPKSYMNLINLGRASDFSSPSFRKHIYRLRRELPFEYGRVINILYEVNIYALENGNKVHDFGKVFQVLDFMLAIGIKPLIELGDKSDNIHIFGQSPFMGAPEKYDEHIIVLLPEFIKNCINRYGYDEVSTWRFELWARYKDTMLTDIESPESYFNRFSFVYNTIKELVPDASVGAPGFNTFLPPEYLDRILRYLKKKLLIPDFITLYLYPYEIPPGWPNETEPHTLLPEDPEFFQHKLDVINSILAKNELSEVPLYVTEFSTHLGFKNHINDSMFQATFITKQVMDSLGQADAFAYWISSDFSMDYPGNKMFLFGGNGLISKQGIKKPGYHAYGFLSMLGERILSRGKHYIVTASENDTYQILIYNYAHFTSDFCKNSEKYELIKYPDSAFLDVDPFKLNVCIENVPSGQYKITRHMIGPDTGCVFHEWEKLNFCNTLSPFEVEHLTGICSPDMTMSFTDITDTLTITDTVAKNEICFINLQRLL